MLLTEEGEGQAAVGGVAALLLAVAYIKDSLVHVKISGNKVIGDLILIAEDEVVEALKYKYQSKSL